MSQQLTARIEPQKPRLSSIFEKKRRNHKQHDLFIQVSQKMYNINSKVQITRKLKLPHITPVQPLPKAQSLSQSSEIPQNVRQILHYRVRFLGGFRSFQLDIQKTDVVQNVLHQLQGWNRGSFGQRGNQVGQSLQTDLGFLRFPRFFHLSTRCLAEGRIPGFRFNQTTHNFDVGQGARSGNKVSLGEYANQRSVTSVIKRRRIPRQ